MNAPKVDTFVPTQLYGGVRRFCCLEFQSSAPPARITINLGPVSWVLLDLGYNRTALNLF